MKLDKRILIALSSVLLLISLTIGFACWPSGSKRPKPVPYQPNDEDFKPEDQAATQPLDRSVPSPTQPNRRRADAPETTEDPAKPKKPVKPPKAGAG